MTVLFLESRESFYEDLEMKNSSSAVALSDHKESAYEELNVWCYRSLTDCTIADEDVAR